MKKIILWFLPLCLLASSLQAGNGKNVPALNQDAKMQWWRDAKLGMFVHWGPYCLYGGVYNGYRQRQGGAEWIMNRCKIPCMEYRAKASTFNPVNFDAEKLVLMAKNAGMKYIVFTTKHHDGFAMFQSDASRFNIVDYTPFKRDIVDELAQACRKHNMKLGFYYSQSQDWCNPGGLTIRKLMKEGWANPDSAEINAFTAAHHGAWDYQQCTRSFNDYFYGVALPQIKELLSRYHDVAVMWFDTPSSINQKQADDIKAELSRYPQIIINDRLKWPGVYADYKTPEGLIPKDKDIEGVDWETCMNIGSSWGYKSWENQWKPSEQIIRNLITIAAKGGNYLLNVGPDALGEVPEEARERLDELGAWMKINGEAIYGTTRSKMTPAWGQCTRKDTGKNTVYYLCVFDWPADGTLLFECPEKIKNISLLANGRALSYKAKEGKVNIDVTGISPTPHATVIKVALKTKLAPVKITHKSDKTFEIIDAK